MCCFFDEEDTAQTELVVYCSLSYLGAYFLGRIPTTAILPVEYRLVGRSS